MGFELQVHPSLAHVKTQQPLQTFHSLTFNDCHPKVRPCWRNMMDEGRDVENFNSEHHQLTSLERYLACQWTRVFSGDQCIVINLWPTYLPGCCILMLFFTYIHKIQVYLCSVFSYFYGKFFSLQKTSSMILTASNFLRVNAVDRRKSDLLLLRKHFQK